MKKIYQIICTSYTETEKGLVLRNNWVEPCVSDENLKFLIKKYNLPNDFPYPIKGSISDILCGKMDLENVVIHIRIVVL